MDYQRACQLYLWAMPIVSFEQLRVVLEGTAGAGPNDVAIYKGYQDLLVFFTPNATTPYTLGYLDLAKTGPVVMDLPVGPTAGAVMDFWQRPLSDLGLAGPDHGNGGKYILVGPGQEAPKADGAFVLRSPTFGVVFFYRALDPDPTKAEVLSKGMRIYRWAKRDNPPPTRYLTLDPNKIAKFMNPPRGMEYWERLSAAIQREPMEDRDRFFMAMLMPLGIEKGKPFQPDCQRAAESPHFGARNFPHLAGWRSAVCLISASVFRRSTTAFGRGGRGRWLDQGIGADVLGNKVGVLTEAIA
jgi:hypothetical protein